MPQPPFNLLLIDEYRANGGKLTLSLGEFSLKDAKMLLLNTTGAQGRLRAGPLAMEPRAEASGW